jgi:methionyl-tRNA formyltransferase
MRILFFGDGPWASLSLERLLEEKYNVLGVVLRAGLINSDLARFAIENNLPVYDPEKVNAREFIDVVKHLSPDLNLSVSYDQIIGKRLREIPSYGFINFHAGKLPYYRGRSIINWAIINGEKEIGITGHFIDEGIDTGDIIVQEVVPIAWDDTYETVLNNVIHLLPGVVSRTVELIHSGQVQPVVQRDLEGSYFSARKVGDEWIDWNDDSRNIYNKVRGITRPGPGAMTLLGNMEIVIWRAYYDPEWPLYLGKPGDVIGRRGTDGVIVKTGDSILLIQEVQVGDSTSTTPSWPLGTSLGIDLIALAHTIQRNMD